MNEHTRRVLVQTIEWASTVLTYGYTDSGHDEFDVMCDRMRWAYDNEEGNMNGQPFVSWDDWFQSRYPGSITPPV